MSETASVSAETEKSDFGRVLVESFAGARWVARNDRQLVAIAGRRAGWYTLDCRPALYLRK